jgi:hypothetical protein
MAARVFGLKCIEHDRAVGQAGRDLVQCRSEMTMGNPMIVRTRGN